MMSIFGWRKSLTISESDPTYKVRYLGNVQTAMMKGDGCVDKPVSIIWNNYMRSSHPGLEMKLVVTGSGLKAYTKEQGLTEYRAHRISYCIAHPQYPRVFVWVYRHEGKKMKMELRCHAVLCKNELKAKSMALQLHEKLSFALKEFQRDKVRKQNSRLVLQRTNSLPKAGSVLPLRKQMLSTATNFKPPVSKSNTAPKLGAITEDFEECEHEEFCVCEDLGECDENDNLESASEMVAALTLNSDTASLHTLNPECLTDRIIDVEIGNDIDELRQNEEIKLCHGNTDSDEESAESGFHDQDQDPREGLGLVEEGEGSVCELPCGDTPEDDGDSTNL
ncbi:protein FAM43A-like [Haliotis cracherodii]|uniref:protein FAM43A-like n=1 Tax=Haliotis cracherodii TaxID=6455 RepID=UPI0039E80869